MTSNRIHLITLGVKDLFFHVRITRPWAGKLRR